LTQTIRKALWPALIAVSFLVFLGAISSARPADAAIPTDGGVVVVDPDEVVGGDLDSCDVPADEDELGDDGIFIINDEGDGVILSDSDDDEDYDIVQLDEDEDFWFCVLPDVADEDVSVDSNEVGTFESVLCSDEDDDGVFYEDDDDSCIGVDGVGDDDFEVDSAETTSDITLGILVNFDCNGETGSTVVTVSQEPGDDFEFVVMCKGDPSTVVVTAEPTTIEVVPAPGNTAHSLIRAVIEDSSGGPVLPTTEVQFSIDRCAIEEGAVDTIEERNEAVDGDGEGTFNGLDLEGGNGDFSDLPRNAADVHINSNRVEPDTSPLSDLFTPASPDIPAGSESGDPGVLEIDGGDDDNLPEQSEALAIVHADLGGAAHAGTCAPGKLTVTVIVSVEDGSDIVRTVELTVIGPPASITVAASPSTLRCGEKATITATIKDSLGQNVSDHTLVEMVTNLGGVLGGTGAVVAGAGAGVVPISSTVAETFAGVATAFLLTSDSHGGPYEVVVTAGGSSSLVTDFGVNFFSGQTGLGSGGIFSTAPISAQVTVNCAAPTTAAPAATISAPRTGTGSIAPPNTGDGGLVDSSGSSWALFLIGGTAAFALAGLATLKFARR
jgi:hypothetical protein